VHRTQQWWLGRKIFRGGADMEVHRIVGFREKGVTDYTGCCPKTEEEKATRWPVVALIYTVLEAQWSQTL
jgi:hypothetical protein